MFMLLLLDAYPPSLLVLPNRDALLLGRRNLAHAVSIPGVERGIRSGYGRVPVLLPITA
jgi:hypothetical protein